MFSVVIPMYNSEDTIQRVLASVAKQTRVDLIKEVIVINDGSTDASADKVKEFQKKNRKLNIILFEQSNKGVSTARNVGIRAAKGNWIALLDSDDVWLKEKIEKQYNILKANPDIVFLGGLAIGQTFRILIKKQSGLYKASIKDLCWRSFPSTPTAVFKREIANELGCFDENLKCGEDIEFFQKFCIKYNYYILCEPVCAIGIQKKRYGESGLSSDLYKMYLGRCECLKRAHDMHAISSKRYRCMLVLSWIKYIRRRFYVWLEKLKINLEKT